jgi:hypothetical protein
MPGGRLAAALCIVLLASPAALAGSSAQAPGKWRVAVKVPGIVDVVGPRTDGRLVLAAHGGLFLMRPGGSAVPFARGPQGYAGSPGEPYLALGSGHRVPGAGCSFRRDEIFALDPDATPGLVRIDRSGRSKRFADLPAGAFPAGITIDTVGLFGFRLLVTSFASKSTTLSAFDCRGRARTVATGGPHVEGGIAVAPRGFGRFGGKLIAPDELTGRIYAFGTGGRVRLVAESGLPSGGDIGTEAVGFVPRGLGRRSAAYLADLGSPGSPTDGSDSLLILAGTALSRAHLHPGELIVATEAGARTLAVRCARICTTRRVADGPAVTHAEGHITFVRRR